MLVYQRVGCSMMETNHLPRQAASCIRVSFATRATSRASVATRSAHLFHVVVPQPLGEPYHLSLGVRCEVGIWWIYKDTLNTCRDLYMNIFMCVYELVILYIYICVYVYLNICIYIYMYIYLETLLVLVLLLLWLVVVGCWLLVVVVGCWLLLLFLMLLLLIILWLVWESPYWKNTLQKRCVSTCWLMAYVCLYIYICVCIGSLSLHNIVYIYIYIYNSIHAYLVFSYMSDTGLIGAWILALVFFAMVVPMESNWNHQP